MSRVGRKLGWNLTGAVGVLQAGLGEPTLSVSVAFLVSRWGGGRGRWVGWDWWNPILLRLGSLGLTEMPRMTWLVKRD